MHLTWQTQTQKTCCGVWVHSKGWENRRAISPGAGIKCKTFAKSVASLRSCLGKSYVKHLAASDLFNVFRECCKKVLVEARRGAKAVRVSRSQEGSCMFEWFRWFMSQDAHCRVNIGQQPPTTSSQLARPVSGTNLRTANECEYEYVHIWIRAGVFIPSHNSNLRRRLWQIGGSFVFHLQLRSTHAAQRQRTLANSIIGGRTVHATRIRPVDAATALLLLLLLLGSQLKQPQRSLLINLHLRQRNWPNETCWLPNASTERDTQSTVSTG